MRLAVVLQTACVLAALAVTTAAPADDSRPEIIEIISPAAGAQESLDSLNLGEPGSELSERNKRTIGILRQLFPTLTQGASAANADENQLLSGAESQQSEVRVQFAEADGKADQDQETAAQTNSAQIDDLSLEDADNSDENRDKRFLNFGLGGGSSGSGGGSGNFLFDIIRLVAGSSGGGSSAAPADAGAADATAAVDNSDGVAKGDGYTEGIPGPITRLFIIANRGIANLIQDLILRLAQTSERIVNFKARLITSII